MHLRLKTEIQLANSARAKALFFFNGLTCRLPENETVWEISTAWTFPIFPVSVIAHPLPSGSALIISQPVPESQTVPKQRIALISAVINDLILWGRRDRRLFCLM